MTIDRETTSLTTCPKCGYQGIVTVIEASQLMWNTEEEDGVENVRLTPGYIFECNNSACLYRDVEPPQY